MYQKRKQKRNEKRKKRIEKRNQEEEEEREEEEEEQEEEEREEEEEEQEEEIRRGLSNKRYVCSCNIENMSHFLLIIHLLFTDGWRLEDGGWRMEKDGGWGRRQLRMKTSTGTFMWKKMSMKQSVHPQLNLYKR